MTETTHLNYSKANIRSTTMKQITHLLPCARRALFKQFAMGCDAGTRSVQCMTIEQNQLLRLCTARTAWSVSVIRLLSLFLSFSAKVLPSWLQNADQWKPDYRVVTNEEPRNYELSGADK